jgi:hypothetical protein
MEDAQRYFENARELLARSTIEDDTYTEVKYVQEACGTAYLAVLKAIDEVLQKKGVDVKDLHQSVDGYREMIKKHLSVHDGKLTRDFEKIYKTLHIAGYYRGLLEDVNIVKDAFSMVRRFIDRISI